MGIIGSCTRVQVVQCMSQTCIKRLVPAARRPCILNAQILTQLPPMARIPPPPSPIPTATGRRSAADPILSQHIDRSAQIPQLKLPPHVARSEPDEIDYQSLLHRETDSIRRFLISVKEFGVVRVSNHGILTEDMRFALANSDRIFGLTVECCTSYGDHEKIVWSAGDHRVDREASAAIGEQNYQIFRQKMENAAIKLEAIAKELGMVIGESSRNEYEEAIQQFGKSTFIIYRYHRANIIDRNSSLITETTQESNPYALSLHLFLEPTEFSLDSASFQTNSNHLVVIAGNQLEEWSVGGIKSAQEKIVFRPFLHTSRPSFSLQLKFTISNLKTGVVELDKTVSLSDQILILLVIALLWNFFSYLFS